MKDLILSPLGLRAGNKLFPCVIGKKWCFQAEKEREMAKRQLESIKLWACYIDLIEYHSLENGHYQFDLVIFGLMT